MLRSFLAAIAIAAVLAGCESAPDKTPPATTAASTNPAGSIPGAVGSVPPDAGISRSGSIGGGEGRGGVQQQELGGRGPAQVAQELVRVGDTVYFGYDSYALDGPAQTTLDQQAAILLRNTGVSVVIEGHCDDRGTREYNLALGERRATTVKDYLVAYGVTPGRIRVISYGKERPVAFGDSDAAQAKNRRAVTVVAGGTPAS